MWLFIEIACEIALGFIVIMGLLYLATVNLGGAEAEQAPGGIKRGIADPPLPPLD